MNYQKVLNENIRITLDRLVHMMEASLKDVVYINSFTGVKGFDSRLEVFRQITYPNQPHHAKKNNNKNLIKWSKKGLIKISKAIKKAKCQKELLKG